MSTDKQKDIAREIARRYITLSKEGLDSLANILVPIKARRGTIILDEGEVCNAMYYVGRGLIRQFYNKNEREVTEHISYEGGMVICIESYFLRQPTIIKIQALENSLLYALPYDQMHELMQDSFEFCNLQLAILQRSLILSQQKADTLRFETAKERYLRTLREHPDIIRRAPLHHVASFLQMTPETLSRVRSAAEESDI